MNFVGVVPWYDGIFEIILYVLCRPSIMLRVLHSYVRIMCVGVS